MGHTVTWACATSLCWRSIQHPPDCETYSINGLQPKFQKVLCLCKLRARCTCDLRRRYSSKLSQVPAYMLLVGAKAGMSAGCSGHQRFSHIQVSNIHNMPSTDVCAYLFRAAAILAWKRTLTSIVAAGPINTSALIVGPDPELMLGLATALASAGLP